MWESDREKNSSAARKGRRQEIPTREKSERLGPECAPSNTTQSLGDLPFGRAMRRTMGRRFAMKILLRFTGSTALALIMETGCLGQHYTRINLVSNTAGVARVTDPQLINPWGMSRSPSSAWWVSDQRTGFSTAYNGAGAKQSLSIAIPSSDPNDKSMPTGTPTGAVF